MIFYETFLIDQFLQIRRYKFTCVSAILFANGCANQIDCVDELSHCGGNDFECDFAYENESAT